jgi:hypothetical protein
MSATETKYEILTDVRHQGLCEKVTAALSSGAQLVGGVCTRDHAQLEPNSPLSDRHPIWAQAVVWPEGKMDERVSTYP